MTTTRTTTDRSPHETCCPDPPGWTSRPTFNPGQELSAEALTTGFDDQLRRLQLLNRAMHGHGVVHGYHLEEDDGQLATDGSCAVIGPGLGLDGHGRMLAWRGGAVSLDTLAGDRPSQAGRYTLYAHYGRRLVPEEGCPPCGKEPRWVEEGVIFSLHCGCTDVDRQCPKHPDGACLTHDDFLAQRTGSIDRAADRIPPADDLAPVDNRPGPLHPSRCGTWRYDPDRTVAVAIACLELCDINAGEADCQPDYRFSRAAPDLGVRPYVYRNPLLAELVNCCDVDAPKIARISWSDCTDEDWERPVAWRRFRDRAGLGLVPENGFAIWFTKPVDADTIHPGSFHLDVLVRQRPQDYWLSKRVDMEVNPITNPAMEVVGAQLEPHEDWFRSELSDDFSDLDSPFQVVVTVRGQLIRDLCGVPLDARPIDLPPGVRCQARPGGDYVSTFQVGGRRRYGRDERWLSDQGDDERSGTEATAERPDIEQPEAADADDEERN